MEAVDAGAVSIAPARLQSIAADDIEARQLEALIGISHVRSQDVTEHIWLAAARRTWAGPTQVWQIKIGFFSVVPMNGEFISDLLDIGGCKRHAACRIVASSIPKIKKDGAPVD